MTLDAAALVTIVRRGEGWEQLVTQAMDGAEARVPATALAEAGMVLVAQGGMLDTLDLDNVVRKLGLTVVPFTEADWFKAVDAYNRQRDATGAARFGDCLTAAVATRTGAAVLTAPRPDGTDRVRRR